MSEKHKKRRHSHPVNEKNLLAATLLNLVITVIEVAGGLLSGSLALLSDAVHNLSDTVATFIAYLATVIGRRKATAKRTFGFKRAEILAALLNAVILIIICALLLSHAWEHWKTPTPVDSKIMLFVAMIGLLANLFAVMILKKDAHKSINVRAAYIHLIGDTLSSILVIGGGLAMLVFELWWVDPLITLLIVAYILKEAYTILREAVNILMQSAPDGLDLDHIRIKMERLPQVKNIHHLHAWALTDNDIHFDAHVELHEDEKLSKVKDIQTKIETLLIKDFHINHITLQFEYRPEHPAKLIGLK